MSWIFTVVVCVQVSVLQGCIFGALPGCAFPCRCSDALGPGQLVSGGTCDPVTGRCQTRSCLTEANTTSHIGQQWHGDGCQTGNVAFLKTAFRIDTGAEANNIVDGWIGSGHACTTVDTGDTDLAASVTVDLGGLYSVDGLVVYNTHDSAESAYLRYFYAMQGKHGDILPADDISSIYNGQVAEGGHSGYLTWSIQTPVRYITIVKNPSAPYKNRMTVCEVAVYGHAYHQVYCSRCNSTEQCHKDRWCEQCTDRWTGYQCSIIAGRCGSYCNCDSGVCESCRQWYVYPASQCNKYIGGLLLEADSTPAVKSSTATTITVTFRQHNMEVDSDLVQYYFYRLRYSINFPRFSWHYYSFTDGTPLIPHMTSLGIRAEREFVIDGLQKNTTYYIMLNLYRRQNGVLESLSYTDLVTGSTACSDKSMSKPTGVSATSGQEWFTVHWANLFYNPTCDHADVVIHYTPADHVTGSAGSAILPAADMVNNPGSYTVTNVPASTYDVYVRITYNSSSGNVVVDSDTVSVTVARSCSDTCVCDSGSSVCKSCHQWYVDPVTDCTKHIRELSLEPGSTPVITSSNSTALTVTFRQSQVDSGTEQHYVYVLQYRTSQHWSYLDDSPLIQHVNGLGMRTEREFVIDGLHKNTSYDIRLVLYRRQNGVQERLDVTAYTTGSTLCSDRSKPTGVYATAGQESFTVYWTNLFYDPTCEPVEADIHYTPVSNVTAIRRLPAADAAINPGSYTLRNVQASTYDVFIRVTYSSDNVVVDSDTVSVTAEQRLPTTTHSSPMTYRPNTDNTLTPIHTNGNNPTPQPTNDNKPTPLPTNGNNLTPLPTHGNNPTPLPTNGNNPTLLPTHGNNLTPLPTHGNNPTPLPTNGNNPTLLPTHGNNPTLLPTHGNNPTPLPTNDNNPTSPTTNDNNPSSAFGNNLVTIAAVAGSVFVIVLIMCVILAVACGCNGKLRRKLREARSAEENVLRNQPSQAHGGNVRLENWENRKNQANIAVMGKTSRELVLSYSKTKV